MLRPALLALAMTVLSIGSAFADDPDAKVYELRTYTAADGKLPALHTRMRDHAMKLLAKHGMTNIAYFEPVDNKENKLYFVIAHKSVEAREASFKALAADAEWQKAVKESEKEGKLTTKAESVLMKVTPYSPPLKVEAKGNRIFELRTYTTPAGGLANINARFRDHTIKLFEKHGITNVVYWNPIKDQKDFKDADITLIYLLAHKSTEAAKASFSSFGKDPEWTAARKASEAKAGGSLTAKDGVKSVMLKPTDYSPLK